MTRKPEGGLRELIRDQATRLFATRGFAGTAVREVAAACGCTKPALYYYYPSKVALFREVIEYHAARINALIAGTVDGTGSVRERMHAGLDGMIDYCIEQPLVMRLVQRLEIAPEDTAPLIDTCVSRDTHIRTLSRLIRAGIEAGELRQDLDALDGAMIIAGATHFQLEQSIASGASGELDRVRIHRIIDLVLDGIAT